MKRRKQASLSLILLAGPFSFILMLVFSPVGLLPLDSGDGLGLVASPFFQTLLTVLWLVVLSVLFISLAPVLEHRFVNTEKGSKRAWTGNIVLLLADIGCCILALAALIAFSHMPLTPLAVDFLLCFACIEQLYRSAACQSLSESSQGAGSVALALLIASGISTAASSFSLSLHGTELIASFMALCAIAWIPSTLSGTTSGENDKAPCAIQPASDTETSTRTMALLRYDWEPLVGGAICALSFGLSWNQGAFDLLRKYSLLLFAGKAVGTLLLALIFWRLRAKVTTHAFEYGVALAACIAVSVWVFRPLGNASPALFALASVSQILFIGILWVETAYTSRELSCPAILPLAGFAVFFCSYIIGALLSLVLPKDANMTIIPLLFVWLLFAVAAHAIGKREAGELSAQGLNDRMFKNSVELMAKDYGLTPREEEVLAYLVFGLSSTSVAEHLYCSPQTVKSHTHRIYVKMGIHSHEELVKLFNNYASAAK